MWEWWETGVMGNGCGTQFPIALNCTAEFWKSGRGVKHCEDQDLGRVSTSPQRTTVTTGSLIKTT